DLRRIEDDALATLLRPLQCGLGILKQCVGIGAIVREQRDAGVRREPQLLTQDLDGLAEKALARRVYRPSDFLRIGKRVEADGEEVVRQTSHPVCIASGMSKPRSDGFKYLVADLHAEYVVDGLEALEID